MKSFIAVAACFVVSLVGCLVMAEWDARRRRGKTSVRCAGCRRFWPPTQIDRGTFADQPLCLRCVEKRPHWRKAVTEVPRCA